MQNCVCKLSFFLFVKFLETNLCALFVTLLRKGKVCNKCLQASPL